ncbi:MAG: DUF4465 domain-containing protein [Pirellulales bacterium]|nr:DUF4465 domain-containing protein [Pirellulales bacterium]
MPIVLVAIGAGCWPATSRAECWVDFEDLGLGPDSYWNGSDGSGQFTSCGLSFNNTYDPTYGSWGGWAYSTKTDDTDPSWSNQYSAITGVGVGGSATYGVAYYSGWPVTTVPTITIPDPRDLPDGLYVTNTTYAYFSMRDGDGFVTAFDDADWQRLTITGKAGESVVGSVDLDLASGTNIVDQWTWLDLTGLQGQGVDMLELSFSGSQAEMVPSYVAVDAVPEPATIAMIAAAACALLWWRRSG